MELLQAICVIARTRATICLHPDHSFREVRVDGELQQVSRRLAGLILKRPSIALALWGEAGIGKTHAALTLLHGVTCPSMSVHATQAVAGIVGALPRPKTLTPWLERSLEWLDRGEALEQGDLVQTFAALLAANAPLLLHVEDLHEAEPERLVFWQRLAVAIARTRGVGLIATSRAQPPDGFEVIRLEPLNQAASDALLEAEAGAALPSDALAWVFAQAAGNPLFTLEFFRLLARRGHLWNDNQRWRWRVPERELMPVTVEAMIERAVDEACTDSATRTALEARAYLESLVPNLRLEPGVWAHVAGLTPAVVEAAERPLKARGVLNETGFVHPLFREVPVAGLNPRNRQAFASCALAVLPLELGAVFVVDAQLGAERSLEVLRRAAQESKTPGRWLALAVEFSSGAERARLALAAARELTATNLHLAEKLYRAALEDKTDFAATLEFIAFLVPHRPDEAQALFAGLPEEYRSSPQGLAVRFGLMVNASGAAGVVAWWQDTLGSSSDLTPDALVHVMQSLKSLDRYDEAIQLADQVLARSDLSPWQRARVLNRKTTAYGESNRFVQALDLTNQLLWFLAEHGLPGRELILHDQALYHKQLGDYRGAQTDLEQALRLALEVGRTPTEMMVRSFLGSLYCELAEYALAEELLLEAFEYQVRQPVNIYLCDTVNNLIELYLAWPDHPSGRLLAQKYARLTLEYAEAMGAPVYLALSRAYAGWVELEHRPDRALDLAFEALDVRVEGDLFSGRWFPTWLEAKARSKLGDRERASDLLEQTVDAFAEMGRVVEANLAGLDLDRLQNDLVSAKDRLEWFRERGLMNAIRQGARLFPELASDVNGTRARTRARVQLQVLGSMQVLLAGKPEPVRGGRRKELLAMLLEARIAGRRQVPRLDLLDALYPEMGETQASAALSNLAYQLRELCGANAILTTDVGYALGEVGSDAEDFLETGETRLWRGEYLEGTNLDGSQTVRETLYRALLGRAEIVLEPDPLEAARVGRLLCEADPYDLESLRLTLKALRASANHKSLKSTYARARANMLEIGEVLPEDWADFIRTPIGKTA